jgi:hypothetical protein
VPALTDAVNAIAEDGSRTLFDAVARTLRSFAAVVNPRANIDGNDDVDTDVEMVDSDDEDAGAYLVDSDDERFGLPSGSASTLDISALQRYCSLGCALVPD